ncbi:unnamed protein product [Acanthosepion pharaonis]|uniref:DUF7041 domain-containing protein n=1 Tax=Acanthosepion pharaonis TaxID=158019 RepID=A0A812E909_ACAPH|nr:unnamed protein product [Sepia pharaonis]
MHQTVQFQTTTDFYVMPEGGKRHSQQRMKTASTVGIGNASRLFYESRNSHQKGENSDKLTSKRHGQFRARTHREDSHNRQYHVSVNILSPSPSLISLATHSPTFPSHIPSSFLFFFFLSFTDNFISALFDAKRITSQRTRYCYLVEKLPADIVEEVMDLLENVPDDNPYDRLKEAILKRTGASNEAMLRNLFTQVELGDRTPSQLLRHMRTLLGDNKMSENIMRSLWLDKLPTTTTQILASMTEETQTEKLADIADRIHESFQSRRVNSIHPQPAQQRDREFNDLKSTVERLSIQLQVLLQKDRQYRRDKCPGYRKRSFSRGRTDNRNRKDEICYYHKRFGPEARRCTHPCSFNNANSGNENSSQ